MSQIDGDEARTISPDISDEALDALSDALEWQLPAANWQQVDSLVDALAQAYAGGDEEDVSAATIELEMMGPTRIRRVGSTPRTPPPPLVIDRINRTAKGIREDKAKQVGKAANDRGKGGGRGKNRA